MLFAIALLHCSSPFLLPLLLHCPSAVSFYSSLLHCPSAVPVLFCRILILAVLVWQSLKTTWTSSGRLIQPSERKYNDYFEKCNTLIKNFIKSCSLFFIYCSSDGNTSTTHGPNYPRLTSKRCAISRKEIRPLCANHLTVDTLPQILVGMVPRAGPLISAAPDSRGTATHICSGILTVR